MVTFATKKRSTDAKLEGQKDDSASVKFFCPASFDRVVVGLQLSDYFETTTSRGSHWPARRP